ncbi:MAG TPA: hypothetical protein VFI11_08035 [Anaerolineales bacterium]|nr:hypothetical protein [Anaerolineales bacterium]
MAVHQRDRDGLARYAALVEGESRRCGHRLYEAFAHRAWGVLHRLEGELDPSEARLQRAISTFQRMGTRWQLGRTYAELAETTLARPDPSAAKVHFERALALFEEMGAVPNAANARQALADLG